MQQKKAKAGNNESKGTRIKIYSILARREIFTYTIDLLKIDYRRILLVNYGKMRIKF